jgi:SAM-dependent methyltransferase
MFNAPYDALASEYYDIRHETSRNFDVATQEALRSLDLAMPAGSVLDVGCGRGRCGEFLRVSPDQVVQLDNSMEMLNVVPREPALLKILHDAEELPFPDGAFATVVAFLCDPYLGLNFLSEARRVLREDGLLLGTTPSYEWGVTLRRELGIDAMTTRFVLQDGRCLSAPSAIYPANQLHEMLRQVGFRPSTIDIRIHTLPPKVTAISRDIDVTAKLLGLSPYDVPILYTFTSTR